jgi:hypothetical protein
MHEVTLKSAQLESKRKKVCSKCAQKWISHHLKCAKRQKKSAQSLQKVCKTSKKVCIFSAKCTLCRLMHTFEKVCTNLPPDDAAYWKAVITKLPQKLKRSGLSRPPDLPDPPKLYLTRAASAILLNWAEHAKVAAEIRHATIRESYDKARYQNVQHFRRLLLRDKDTLDQSTLRAARVIRQPRQRMWGITGRAV